jgi:hypothetical protein
MVQVKADKGLVRLTFSTKGMSPEQINDFVTWLRVEGVARHSQLTEQNAWRLSEDIKADWWEENKQRFTK